MKQKNTLPIIINNNNNNTQGSINFNNNQTNTNLKKKIKNTELQQFDRSRLKQVKRTSTVDYVKDDDAVWS